MTDRQFVFQILNKKIHFRFCKICTIYHLTFRRDTLSYASLSQAYLSCECDQFCQFNLVKLHHKPTRVLLVELLTTWEDVGTDMIDMENVLVLMLIAEIIGAT